nr:IS3 family transposase [Lentibacillus halodurans]
MHQNEYQTYKQLVQAIEEYIHFYNFERYQQRLNGLSPMEYREEGRVNPFYYFHCLLNRGQFKRFGFIF